MKKYGLLGGSVLAIIALALIAGPFLVMAQELGLDGWRELDPDNPPPVEGMDLDEVLRRWPEVAVLHEVVSGTGESRVLEEEELAGIRGGVFLSVLEDLKRNPLSPALDVPQAITERILKEVYAEDTDAKILFVHTLNDLYNALVMAIRDGERAFVEVIIEGNRAEVKEIEPVLLDETSTEEKVIEEFEVGTKDPAALATALAKIVSWSESRIYKLQLQTHSLVWITHSRYREGRNVFGWLLWRVTAKGHFLINPGVAVLHVSNASSTETAWGWTTDWFHSHPTWSFLLGEVRAVANFDGPPPLRQDITAEAWAGVCRHGHRW